MNKKQLYENIMKNVQKELNNVLNEEKELSPSEKMDAWHNGERDENIKACGTDKLKKYKAICQAKGYDAEVAALQAEIDKRGLKESAIFENEEPDIREKYGDEFADLVGDVNDGVREINTEKDSEILFNALVPGSGNADNLGGELLRAAERIAYRYYNDGDKAGEGYGRETVNPAVRFMYANITPTTMNNPLWISVKKIFSFVDRAYCDLDDKQYEELVMRLLRQTVIYIIQNRLWNVPNKEDMLDYKNDEEDVDRDEWDEEDW